MERLSAHELLHVLAYLDARSLAAAQCACALLCRAAAAATLWERHRPADAAYRRPSPRDAVLAERRATRNRDRGRWAKRVIKTPGDSDRPLVSLRGARLAVASRGDRAVCAFDLGDGSPSPQHIDLDPYKVKAVGVHEDGRVLACSAHYWLMTKRDRRLFVWDGRKSGHSALRSIDKEISDADDPIAHDTALWVGDLAVTVHRTAGNAVHVCAWGEALCQYELQTTPFARGPVPAFALGEQSLGVLDRHHLHVLDLRTSERYRYPMSYPDDAFLDWIHAASYGTVAIAAVCGWESWPHGRLAPRHHRRLLLWDMRAGTWADGMRNHRTYGTLDDASDELLGLGPGLTLRTWSARERAVRHWDACTGALLRSYDAPIGDAVLAANDAYIVASDGPGRLNVLDMTAAV